MADSRQALRDFYRLAAETPAAGERPDETGGEALQFASGPELADPETYVAEIIASGDLGRLARAQASLTQEIRELESEQKALVYNNYKKLIRVAETLDELNSKGALEELGALQGPFAAIAEIVDGQVFGDVAAVEPMAAALGRDWEEFSGGGSESAR